MGRPCRCLWTSLNHAVRAVAERRVVVRFHAEEFRLNRGAVGIVDQQAIGSIAADHVVKHERIGVDRASEQRIVVGPDDRRK
jgi:hypothetical protein